MTEEEHKHFVDVLTSLLGFSKCIASSNTSYSASCITKIIFLILSVCEEDLNLHVCVFVTTFFNLDKLSSYFHLSCAFKMIVFL